MASPGAQRRPLGCGSYPIASGIASKTGIGTCLPRHILCVRLRTEYTTKSGETRMTSRIEAYRVQAYNTAKLSENKMHDDTVAKRFGFSGGPGAGGGGVGYLRDLSRG